MRAEDEATAARHRIDLVQQGAGPHHRGAGLDVVVLRAVFGEAQPAAVIVAGIEMDRDRTRDGA